MMEVLKDWNFWLSIVTITATIIALFQTSRQIKLSNRQSLFDRRISLIIYAKTIYCLLGNSRFSLEKREEGVQFGIAIPFCEITNSSIFEEMANVVSNPLKQPFHRSFLAKKEEIVSKSYEIKMVFKKDDANDLSCLLVCYSELLQSMYKYIIALSDMEKYKNEPSFDYKNWEPELEQRADLFSKIKEAYEAFDNVKKRNLFAQLEKEIKL